MSDKIFVTKPSIPTIEEYVNEISDIWDSRILTNSGEKHKEFSKRLAEYIGAYNVELFTNGHMALEISLQALGIKGEVITTPFTFASTTHAIVRQGLTPVFCDIREDDYTIDADKIEALITENTGAIMPVHVYGNLCDFEKIQKIADKYNLKVIYDAAHAFGERIDGEGVCNFGDVSCFSFHATKVFNSIEGGAVCFKDEALREKFASIKNFGLADQVNVVEIGTNAKMNEFCAAMGLCNLRHADENIEKRFVAETRYRELLDGIKGIKLRPLDERVTQNHSYFPIIVERKEYGMSRDELMLKLADKNIFARKYFFPLTSQFDCYKSRFNSAETPIAKHISESVLCLPMYAELSTKEVDRICEVIRNNG